MPRSRNTRLRPKDTSRAEARRRHRDELREVEGDPGAELEGQTAAAVAAQPSKPMFAMPDVAGDLRALPQVFRTKLVWLPFLLLALTFALSVGLIYGAFAGLPEPVTSVISLYISLTLHPTSLFIFFIGGFVAPRASYIVGGILGVLSAVIYLAVLSILNAQAGEQAVAEHADTLLAAGGQTTAISTELIVQTVGMGLVIGIFAGGFASWYRRFLRSSQERAAANRAQRDREQAAKAKEQARLDREQARAQKYAAREARRKSS